MFRCSVEGCEKARHGPSVCRVHNPLIAGPKCTQEGCERRRPRSEDLCSIHRGPDRATYDGAHQRVRTVRGRASTHVCIDCGGQAEQWAYNHLDPNELHGEVTSRATSRGRKPLICAYSCDPSYYDPLCRRCHNKRDRLVSLRRVKDVLAQHLEPTTLGQVLAELVS